MVYLSQIFKFDKKHFDALGGGSLNFILPYLSAEKREVLQKGKFTVDYLDYDWKANDIRSAR